MIDWWPHGSALWTSILMSYLYGGLWTPVVCTYFIWGLTWMVGNSIMDEDGLDVKAYVIHYTPLKERKVFLKNQLEQEQVAYTFIERYDREVLYEGDMRRFDLRRVRLSMCSNIMKHLLAYQMISHASHKYNLILEDDAVLSEGFIPRLRRGLDELPDDYDMLFIGDGMGMHIASDRLEEGRYVYRKDNQGGRWGKGPEGAGATRCTDSYLVSKRCAKILSQYVMMLPAHAINVNSDLWLNEVIRRFNFNIYWLEPTIVTQGTQNGMYNTSHGL